MRDSNTSPIPSKALMLDGQKTTNKMMRASMRVLRTRMCKEMLTWPPVCPSPSLPCLSILALALA